MSNGEFHLEIITMAEADEAGVLHFTEGSARQLVDRFCEILETPDFPAAVDGYVRAVAAFQAGGQTEAAAELMELGTQAVEIMRAKNAPAADKLQASVTGADNLSTMKPVGSDAPPPGAVKATAFIRPPPKNRG